MNLDSSFVFSRGATEYAENVSKTGVGERVSHSPKRRTAQPTGIYLIAVFFRYGSHGKEVFPHLLIP